MQLRHRPLPIRPRRAFTAVELVIVVLVMGILAAVAAPKFVHSLRFHAVQSAARRVKADLEHLRQTARLTSRTQTITFTGLAYEPDEASDVEGMNHADDTYQVDLAAPPYEINGATIDFGASGLTISFDAYGMPLDANGQPLEEGDGVTLRAGAHERKIETDAQGNVRIVRPY